jgi:hypothetical protein
VWLRPYVGSGVGAGHYLTFRAFGGSELTFATVPQFALSGDLGYRWAESPFAGFTVSISAHWYFK